MYDEFLAREIAAGRISADAFRREVLQVWLHGHCHQKALVGIEKTATVLRTLLPDAELHVIPSGCCGMAGSFGYEREHYETSMAIGEMVLFPAVRSAVAASPEALLRVPGRGRDGAEGDVGNPGVAGAANGALRSERAGGQRPLNASIAILAPGTSCRQQILDGTGVQALHPVELLYRSLKA